MIGGGNSAGQAAVFLAAHAYSVTMLARRPLAQTMSHYLIERIASQPNIHVLEGAQIETLEGDGSALEAICWRGRDEADPHRLPVRQLFLFIGADPNTDWLARTGIKLDPGSFVVTGKDAAPDRLPLESSRSGIFAVGDVRSDSVKRVAAAAGDGAWRWRRSMPGSSVGKPNMAEPLNIPVIAGSLRAAVNLAPGRISPSVHCREHSRVLPGI